MRRNPRHKRLSNCCLSLFRTLSCIICDFRTSLREFLDAVVNHFTRQKLLTVNRNISSWIIFCIESSVVLKQGRQFDYWNEPLNMRICVCYLDCHEAGLCCYLVVHVEKLLRPLQLSYFHFPRNIIESLFHWMRIVLWNVFALDSDYKFWEPCGKNKGLLHVLIIQPLHIGYLAHIPPL
jgi:hypothetical protein